MGGWMDGWEQGIGRVWLGLGGTRRMCGESQQFSVIEKVSWY